MDPIIEETSNTTSPETLQDKKSSHFWKEFIQLTLLALLIVVPFRLYVAQPFIVDGASMDPTFETGDYLIVDELSYFFKTPERGSVLIFKYPRDTRKSFIKRVIGLPGETISIKNGEVTIVNKEFPEGFVLNEPYIEFKKNENFNHVLSMDEYFVLGDNRPSSSDSRIWGPVPKENIVGRPIIRFFPPALFPGDKTRLEYTEN